MPKSTFFRLADEKRHRLVKAAYEEFARAPFNEASISNIIKDAGIPRGSFYQYFDDKADVYFYLMDRMKDSTEAHIKDAMVAHDNDLFAAVADMFDETIDAIVEGPHAAFFQNMFMYMDFHAVNKMSGPPVPPKGHGQLTSYLVEHADRTKLRVENDNDVRMLVRQIMGLFMQTIGYYYNRKNAGEEISLVVLKHRLAQMLDWLQFGVAKG